MEHKTSLDDMKIWKYDDMTYVDIAYFIEVKHLTLAERYESTVSLKVQR